jgi:hypothetical protein
VKVIALNPPELTLLLLPGVLVFRGFVGLPARWFWAGFCVLLAASAAWALAVAVDDAITLGTVSLPGSRYRPRADVPWPQAWAYLLGLTLIAVASLTSRIMNPENQRHGDRILAAAATVVLGYVLVVIAPLLSSLFLSLSAMFCLAVAWLLAFTDAKFGRAAMWFASALLFAAYCYSLYLTV